MLFSPTYLYIKQHTKTGKLYFGKTTKSEEYLLNEYYGSGSYWMKHISKHGKEYVVTLWYELFYDITELVSFATTFSIELDIVNSDSWANLSIENGLDGLISGYKLSDETKAKMSKVRLGKKRTPHTKETKDKISAAHVGRKHTSEHIKKSVSTRMNNHNTLSDDHKSIIAKSNRKYKQVIIKDPSGTIYTMFDGEYVQFGKDHDLHPSFIWIMLKSKNRKHKGYTLISCL